MRLKVEFQHANVVSSLFRGARTAQQALVVGTSNAVDVHSSTEPRYILLIVRICGNNKFFPDLPSSRLAQERKRIIY